MAVAFTNLDTNSSTTDTTGAFTTASVTPTANQPVLAAVMTSVASGSTPTASLSGCGLTWSLVNNTTVGTRTAWLFLGIGSSPTAGAISISGDGTTSVTSCFWSVAQCSGVDTTTNNGVVQSTNAKPTSLTSVSSNFTNTVVSTNATFAGIGEALSTAPTAGTGWTALATGTTQSAPTSGFLAEYATTAQQTIAASLGGTATNAFVVGAEMKASSSGGSPSLADTGSGADALTVHAAIPLSDTGSGADAETVAVPVAIADTGSGADALSHQVTGQSISLADTGSGTSSMSVSVTLAPPALGNSGTLLAYGARNNSAVPVPSGVSANDIILLYLYWDTTTPSRIYPPTGFTKLAFSPDPSGANPYMNLAVYWKRATGADTGTYTFTHSTTYTQGLAVQITGAAPLGSPVEVLGSATRSTSGTVTPAVSGTTADANELLVIAAMDYSMSSTWTTITGWTNAQSGSGEYVAAKLQATAGATGSLTVTAGTANAQVVALVGVMPQILPKFADTGAGVDAFGAGNNITPRSDSGTGTDALSVAAHMTSSDTGAAADGVSVHAAVPMAETGSGVDALAIARRDVWLGSTLTPVIYAGPNKVSAMYVGTSQIFP